MVTNNMVTNNMVMVVVVLLMFVALVMVPPIKCRVIRRYPVPVHKEGQDVFVPSNEWKVSCGGFLNGLPDLTLQKGFSPMI